MKIVFTGGGTAGHIFPIVAVARELKRSCSAPQDLKLFYFGPKDEYSFQLLVQEGIKIKKICSGKIRRYFSLLNILDIFKVPLGIWQAWWALFFLAPDIIFSKGGYGSFPVAFAAWFLRIPIFLHESDVVPGVASKIQSKWAVEIFTSFPDTEYFPKEKVMNVGNPVRQEILKGSKEEAKRIFELKGDRPLILAVGGSQGAKCLNNLILEILPELLREFELVHQTGKQNFKEVKAESEVMIEDKTLQSYCHIFPFLDEQQLNHILFACDFVVSRGGAGSIFEIAACGKPAILIPLASSAQDHQLKNSYRFAESGAGEVITEENLKPHFFLERLKFFFSRRDILQEMADSSLAFARPKAGKIIANYLLEYLNQTLN